MADGKSSKRFELTSEKRPAPFLIADARALDFLNSVATPVDTPLEWIESGQDLLSWLGAAGLISPSVRAGFQKSAVPGELDAVAAQARALREWFRSFVQKHRGQPLRQDAVKEIEPLNRVLGRDEAFGQIMRSIVAIGGRSRNSRGESRGAGALPTPCCSQLRPQWLT